MYILASGFDLQMKIAFLFFPFSNYKEYSEISRCDQLTGRKIHITLVFGQVFQQFYSQTSAYYMIAVVQVIQQRLYTCRIAKTSRKRVSNKDAIIQSKIKLFSENFLKRKFFVKNSHFWRKFSQKRNFPKKENFLFLEIFLKRKILVLNSPTPFSLPAPPR